MLSGLTLEARAALGDLGRRAGFIAVAALLALAGAGFAIAALWTVTAAAWGGATASAAFAAAFLVLAGAIWLIGARRSRSAAEEAELARARRAAQTDAMLTAFRVGAEIGGRMSNR